MHYRSIDIPASVKSTVPGRAAAIIHALQSRD